MFKSDFNPTVFPEKPEVFDKRGYFRNFSEFRAKQIKDFGENYWNNPAYIKQAGAADFIVRKKFDEIINSKSPLYMLWRFIKKYADTQKSVRNFNSGFELYRKLPPQQRPKYCHYLLRNWNDELQWRKEHPDYPIQDKSTPAYVLESQPLFDFEKLILRLNEARLKNENISITDEEMTALMEGKRMYNEARGRNP